MHHICSCKILLYHPDARGGCNTSNIVIFTAQKMKFFTKNVLSQFRYMVILDLVIITEVILNGKLFLCTVFVLHCLY